MGVRKLCRVVMPSDDWGLSLLFPPVAFLREHWHFHSLSLSISVFFELHQLEILLDAHF